MSPALVSHWSKLKTVIETDKQRKHRQSEDTACFPAPSRLLWVFLLNSSLKLNKLLVHIELLLPCVNVLFLYTSICVTLPRTFDVSSLFISLLYVHEIVLSLHIVHTQLSWWWILLWLRPARDFISLSCALLLLFLPLFTCFVEVDSLLPL